MSEQPPCPSWVDLSCMLPIGHMGPHYNDDDDLIWREPTVTERQMFAAYVRDDPPEYDPYDDAAGQAEDHAASQLPLAAIEAEEARDAAGEAWQAGAYPSGVTDPGETSGPRGLA